MVTASKLKGYDVSHSEGDSHLSLVIFRVTSHPFPKLLRAHHPSHVATAGFLFYRPVGQNVRAKPSHQFSPYPREIDIDSDRFCIF
jgi:hypothetical protein